MEAQGQAAPAGADWGKPLVRWDAAWQRLEGRLVSAVLMAEIAVISLWVLLRGLASDYFPGQAAGGLFTRAMLTMVLFAVGAHLGTRKRGVTVSRVAVSVAILLGLLVGRAWAHAGVTWSSNLLNWLQNASIFMLVGGLRGLATRLTFWVAFLGASLATSRGKHIYVDVLLRYVPAKMRTAVAVLGLVGATTVCIVAVVGFIDYISIAAYQAPATKPCPDDGSKVCDTGAGEKLGVVAKETAGDFFLLGRQISLDARTAFRVLVGTPYDTWMSARQWNEWIDGADWGAHFDKVQVDAQKVDASEGATHMPAVQVPGGGESRGLLVRELDFVFPFGLAIIAIKFALRVLILLSGQAHVDVDAEENEEALVRANARDEAAARGAGL